MTRGQKPGSPPLLPQIDRPGLRERIVHEIQKVFDGRVIWGEDLMQLTVATGGVATIEGCPSLDDCDAQRPPWVLSMAEWESGPC